jgi:hypothetical protein
MMHAMNDSNLTCTSCYGTGEVVTEQGGVVCPDCFGAGRIASGGAGVEWRLRALESRYTDSNSDVVADVQWLMHELRRGREALVRILTRCQDASDDDVLARDVRFEANEALGLYDPDSENDPAK